MSKVNLKSKKTWKNILAIVLSCALAIGSIVGITALFEKIDETTTKTITPTYKVGGINATTGKGDSSITSSIYTKDAFECQGLKITPDFDSAVSYEVFFYDNNEQFLSSSGSKTDFYESDNIFAKYARIVITPLEDDKVSWFEISKYSSQLKVEVSKKEEVFVNQFSICEDMNGKTYVYNGTLGSKLTVTEDVNYTAINQLVVRDCSVIYFKYNSQSKGLYNYFFLDENNNVILADNNMGAKDINMIEIPYNAEIFVCGLEIGSTFDIYVL